jgi:uridylate kinase
MEKRIIISLGGSLIVADEVRVSFLKTFKEFIEHKIQEGYTFILITGGGRTARKYVEALAAIHEVSDEEKDWLGIYATRLNANLVKSMFGTLACEEIITDPTKIPTTDKPIIIGAGWKPGNSTDLPPVVLAASLGLKTVINLSNIDYVFTADPKTDPSAQKIEDISWEAYWKLIPKEWKPGLHAPFDPVASKKAEENGISVCAINGEKLEELEKCIEGKPFLGTYIHP